MISNHDKIVFGEYVQNQWAQNIYQQYAKTYVMQPQFVERMDKSFAEGYNMRTLPSSNLSHFLAVFNISIDDRYQSKHLCSPYRFAFKMSAFSQNEISIQNFNIYLLNSTFWSISSGIRNVFTKHQTKYHPSRMSLERSMPLPQCLKQTPSIWREHQGVTDNINVRPRRGLHAPTWLIWEWGHFQGDVITRPCHNFNGQRLPSLNSHGMNKQYHLISLSFRCNFHPRLEFNAGYVNFKW